MGSWPSVRGGRPAYVHEHFLLYISMIYLVLDPEIIVTSIFARFAW